MRRSSFLIASPIQQQFGIAILRIIAGVVFVAHGAQKVFVYGFGGVGGAFAQMGVPMPTVTGPIIALIELFGGVALIVGLFTRVAALALACDMLGAIILVHAAGGFFLPKGLEFVLMLLGSALALLFAGPGALSVDGALASRRDDRRDVA
jgi:putative oxidoreductase